MTQDLELDARDRRRRLDAETLAQGLSESLEGTQRVRLASTAVQRDHQLAPQRLVEGMLGDLRFDLPDDGIVVPEREFRIDPDPDASTVEFVESRRFPGSNATICKVDQGFAAPQRPGLPGSSAREVGPGARERGGCRFEHLSHHRRVDVDVGIESITTVFVAHRLGADQTPKPRDVAGEGAFGRRGWVIRPERLDQGPRRDHRRGASSQDGEQRSFLRRVDPDRTLGVGHLDRTEDPDPHSADGTAPACAVSNLIERPATTVQHDGRKVMTRKGAS